MLSKILKVNQVFIPFLLYIISAGVILLTFLPQNNAPLSWIPFVLLLISIALIVSYSSFISFFKGTHYFEFFALSVIVILLGNLQDLSFFSGFLFLNISLLQLLDEKDMSEKLLSPFDIGFFMAVSVLLYPPFWIFIPFLLLHYIALSKIQIQGFLLSVLGVLTVALLTFEVCVFFNIQSILPHILKSINLKIPISFNFQYLWFLPIFIALIISIIDYAKNANKHFAEKKIVYFNSIVLLIFTSLFYILYGTENNNALLLFAIPLAILITNYMLYTKIIYKELILWGFLFSLLMFKYSSLIELPGVLKNVSF